MSTIEELVTKQDEIALEINKAILNIKKTPKDRRTLDYYNKKASELAILWKSFNDMDNTIRRLPGMPEDHPYLQTNFYEEIKQKHNSAYNELEDMIKSLQRTTASSQVPQSTAVQPIRHSLVVKQQTVITSINNMLDELLDGSINRNNIYLTSKLRLIDNHVITMQQLHNKICAEDIDYDIESYISAEELIGDKIIRIQEMQEGRLSSSPHQEASVHLPKVTIQPFNGDYLQWRAFYDLFSEMIHKQPIPDIKKMWFLKTNVTGEAQKLIQHLSLTEANYTTAWTMLQDRYNNMRILTFTLLEKLTGQPKLQSENTSAAAIRNLHDTTQETVLALNNLGVDTKTWDPIILHIILNKLDKGTHMLYEQSLSCPREIPSLEEFLKFLENRFQSLEAIGQKNKQPSTKTCSSATTKTDANEKKCSLCQNSYHPLYRCQKFLNQSTNKRLQHLKWNKLCINCLKPGHYSNTCSARHCTKCEHKHNTLVHNDEGSVASPKQHNNTIPSTVASAHHLGGRQGYVLLATAQVRIQANNGQVGVFKAILDSGSQINIVTERLVKQLNIKPSEAALRIEGIGRRSRHTNKRVNVCLQSRTSTFKTRLEAFVLPSIIPDQPAQKFEISSWSIPENIQLADPDFNKTNNIDVLLGAEYYLELMTTGRIQLSNDLPTLQNTKLGWTVSGKIKQNADNSVICAVYGEDDTTTSELLQRFWKLDDFELDNNLTIDEQKCETHFVQNTVRSRDGRFIVRLPFSDNPRALGETKGVALSRFQALERRLSRDPILRSQYVDFMDQYEALGHMTSISDEVPNPHFYIPHHCVLRPESSTTKLRVVFDASAKSASGLSLNDILYTGPTTQGDLFGMLLRFRLPRFVFCTDIEKMYRQILVDPADRDMQLIFWRKSPTEAIQTYKLNTITYGTSAAPYLATKCLQQLADRNMDRYPLGAPTLKNDFYMDDGMSGSDNLRTAVEVQQQLTNLLQEAGFKLRKWCANHSQLLRGIPPEDLEVNLDFDNQSTKVLGLAWTPKSDLFCLKADVHDNKTITKRSVTSDMARIFDPLGIAGPVVVSAKIFIQQLWEQELKWDDPLPANLVSTWTTFRQNLKLLNHVYTKRHIFDGKIPKHTQIHTFVDASEKAYGAAVYLRSRLQDGRIIVRLLCAKSRVAPLKKLTLPRLELSAAVLGAELTTRVKKELRFENNQTYFWSDSEIVLHWIHSQSSSLRTFVANRISKIQELTINNQWRHVSSKQNPADYISRGLNPEKLSGCDIWFYGPIFLHDTEDHWPKEFSTELQCTSDLEFKPKAVTTALASQEGLEDIIYNINHRDSFKVLQEVVAYMQRFIRNLKVPKTDRPTTKSLNPRELTSALYLIVRTVQAADFRDDIDKLKGTKGLSSTSPISSLSPFLDENGVLRVGGRLGASNLPYDAKHPMLLPYNDSISKLILKMIHRENHHCGPQTLLAISRQQFWVIKGKSMARNTVQTCVRCTRSKPNLLNQVMGELPASRVTPARPFIRSGVDYCGPFWVHYKIRGKRPHKVYVAVFICFATKAVHLEVVSDLTTEAFIGALKRFLARRGRCQTIYSDNATNFVGARNQLQELNESIYAKTSQEAIIRSCSKEGIDFKFIPPRAPHFGGLWEAAVKSAKQLLLRSVSTASLTHEELETVIIEIEAILNSRPLTPMSTSPNDLTALTPGHFIIGEPLTAQVDSNALRPTCSLPTRWKLVSQLKHDFWRRWSTEYLNQLQEKRKWKTSVANVKEGQMVIIKEDNLPVMRWPLGRIIQTHTGNDGKVRVVDIKTASGTTRRPIHRLAPLLHEDEEELPERQTAKSRPMPTDIVPPKKHKPLTSSMLFTMLITLLLIPAVISSNLQINKFSTDPGLYFEGIGTTKLVTAEWKIMVYYDLGPFSCELRAFSSGILALQQLCSEPPNLPMCEVLIHNFDQIKEELFQEGEMLSANRPKRAAFNIIGNIARSLFGVLDSDYAEEMASTINQAKIEKGHIVQLLKNQTSIIDSTINIIKQDETRIQENLNKILERINQQTNEVASQISNTQLMGLLSTHLIITATNLRRIESELIDVLTDAHNGRISPLLISPHQLRDELTTIKAHLPASRNLPIEGDDLIQLYKLMNAKGAVTRNEVIFEIRLPLVDQQSLELFKIIPVPTVKNETLIAIAPVSSYLAVNSHRDQYIPLSTEDITNCVKDKNDVYICKNKLFKLGKNSKFNACEISIFNNKNTTSCKLVQLPGDSAWTQLNNQNKWIFSISTAIEISAVCGAETMQILLTGSGIMEIASSCVIKNNLITIQGHYGALSNLHTSYARFKQIESISTHQEIKGVFNTTSHPLKLQLDQLNDLQSQLKESTLIHIPKIINSNTRHHHAVSYTALILSILLLLAITAMKFLPKRSSSTSKKDDQNNLRPIPRPRPITIDIIDT